MGKAASGMYQLRSRRMMYVVKWVLCLTVAMVGIIIMININIDNNPAKINELKIRSALIVLEREVKSNGLRFFRGSIVRVLKQWFPNLPRNKAKAYEQLKKDGYYATI